MGEDGSRVEYPKSIPEDNIGGVLTQREIFQTRCGAKRHATGRDRALYKSVFSEAPDRIYDLKPMRVPGLFGAFNMSKAKSDLEWQIHRAAQMPSPLSYSPAPSSKGKYLAPTSGGKFNESQSKSEIEWVIYRASQMPGPGANDPPKLSVPSGGRFNTSNAKSELDWAIFRAKQLPGPGEGDPKFDLQYPNVGAARFNSKPRLGNYQTGLPDAVLYTWETVPASPANSRTDGSCGKQVLSTQRSSPSVCMGVGGRDSTIDPQYPTNQSFYGTMSKASKRMADVEQLREERAQERKSRMVETGSAELQFQRFFGYSPASVKSGKTRTTPKSEGAAAMRRMKSGKKDRRGSIKTSANQQWMRPGGGQKLLPFTGPGPGSYTLPSTLAKQSHSFGYD